MEDGALPEKPKEHPVRTLLRLKHQPEYKFARRLGIAPGSLSNLLNYKRMPSARLLIRLSEETGIPPKELLEQQ